MSIHYKFKSALEYDTVTFDGLHISVKDLKKQILHQKKIGKSTDFDLQITNAQTKETYTDENELISKNTSLIVARVPVAVQPRKQWDRDNHTSGAKSTELDDGGLLGLSVDIANLDLPEEEKIKTMMSQSTGDYDPSKYELILCFFSHENVLFRICIDFTVIEVIFKNQAVKVRFFNL